MPGEMTVTTFLAPLAVMLAISLCLALVLIVASKYLAEYGPCTITVNKSKQLKVTGGDNLLSLLFSGKIFIPSACGGRGSCGYCKVRVVEGGGSILPTERPYLAPAEIEDNVRLSCQVKVKNDIAIEIPDQYLAIQEYRAKVMYSKDLTYDMKEIRFKLIDPPEIHFKPGQYIQFNVPTKKGGTVYRAYSISSTPSIKDEIELIVRIVPGGLGSTYIHSLREGDEAAMSGPYGEFFLHERSDYDVLCVGGGAGMAPLKSIIYSLFDMATDRNVRLYFGVRAEKDIFYLKEFEKLAREHPNFSYVYALSSPDETDNWKGETGFIHLVLEKHLLQGENKEAYLCGPPVMVEAVIKVLKEKGVSNDHIYFDKF